MADLTFPRLGDVDPGSPPTRSANKTAVSITAGQVLRPTNTVTPNALVVAGAADVGPFFVAAFDAASGDITVAVAEPDSVVTVKANAAIQPYSKVVADASGTVKAATNETFDKVVGFYIGHPGENTGTVVPTAAAQNDLIRIQLGGGF